MPKISDIIILYIRRQEEIIMAGSHIAIPTILKIGKGVLNDLGTYLANAGIERKQGMQKWCFEERKKIYVSRGSFQKPIC